MEKCGLFEAKGAVEQELAAGAGEQIGSAHDFRDSQVIVIDRAGELVAGQVVFSPDEEIPEIAAGDFCVQAECAIDEGNRFAIRDAKSPVYARAFAIS